MTRPTVYGFVAAFIVLAGLARYEMQVASRQNQALVALRQRAAQLAAESASLRRERDATAQDLAAAEQQLAAVSKPRPDDPTFPPERRNEMKAWLSRVKNLHQLFDARPDQRIPEMQFLTDQDWLRVAKNARFDTEDDARRALAAMRDAAISHFTPQLSAALRKLIKSPGIDGLLNIYVLAPLLERPGDAPLLERYELVKGLPDGLRLGGEVTWTVQTKAPVDAGYDSRVYVSASDSGSFGFSSAGAPAAWIPNFGERLTRATKDYTAARNGSTPVGLADILPFFNPPLDPAVAQNLLKTERERKR